jgi:nascent polypeptide-associated complex subunit alpha
MFPGMNMNSKQMKQAMKKMGMKQEDFESSQVIIKTPEGDIIIDNPQVSRVDMMGQETWQVVGESRFVELNTTPDISEDDIQTVIEQTNCSEELARQTIEKYKGDLAEAILEISNIE